MRNYILQMSFSLVLVACPLAVHSKVVNKVNIMFCDVGTSCQKCSETAPLQFERIGQSVFMSGKGVDGKHVRESLPSCTFTSKGDWICKEVRMSISSESGRISAKLLKDMPVSGKKQEVCVTQ